MKSFPIPSDVASTALVDAGDGTLVGCGPDGTALIDIPTGSCSVDPPPGESVWVLPPSQSLTTARSSSSGPPRSSTARRRARPRDDEFATAAEWTTKAGLLSDGSLYIVNQRTTPFITRFPRDGSGPISRLAVPGAVATAGFVDDSSIVVSTDQIDLYGQPMSVVWDLAHGHGRRRACVEDRAARRRSRRAMGDRGVGLRRSAMRARRARGTFW